MEDNDNYSAELQEVEEKSRMAFENLDESKQHERQGIIDLAIGNIEVLTININKRCVRIVE